MPTIIVKNLQVAGKQALMHKAGKDITPHKPRWLSEAGC
jgi:hypothetical protein